MSLDADDVLLAVSQVHVGNVVVDLITVPTHIQYHLHSTCVQYNIITNPRPVSPSLHLCAVQSLLQLLRYSYLFILVNRRITSRNLLNNPTQPNSFSFTARLVAI